MKAKKLAKFLMENPEADIVINCYNIIENGCGCGCISDQYGEIEVFIEDENLESCEDRITIDLVN